jgi:hypothetical protein
MTNIELLEEQFPEDEYTTADGFDEAILGLDPQSGRIIYDIPTCLEILQRDMSEEDAIEYFDFNVLGAYVGLLTPIFMLPVPKER